MPETAAIGHYKERYKRAGLKMGLIEEDAFR
jgi:hypothetical protein